mmetsp:Transcript_16454/g.45936  ORF Transcript_16454/g.45936 Transcript_16454/m.45936 type:complete len:160 (+) Transcript_16454:85-564(+)
MQRQASHRPCNLIVAVLASVVVLVLQWSTTIAVVTATATETTEYIKRTRGQHYRHQDAHIMDIIDDIDMIESNALENKHDAGGDHFDSKRGAQHGMIRIRHAAGGRRHRMFGGEEHAEPRQSIIRVRKTLKKGRNAQHDRGSSVARDIMMDMVDDAYNR